MGSLLDARRFLNVKSTFEIERKFTLLKIHKKLNMFEVARIFTFSIVASTYSTLQLVKKVLNRVEYPFVMMVSALHLAFAMSVNLLRSYSKFRFRPK